MIIRQARVEEAKAVFEAESLWTQIPGHLVSYPGEVKESVIAQSIQECLNSRTGRYLVAEQESRIVAHACVLGMPMQAHRHIGRVTIVVHEGFTNQGVGRKIFEELLNWAKNSSDLKKLELLVRSTNLSALHLYKSLGFVEEGRFVKRIKLPTGEFIDDISMGLLFP